MIVSHANRFVYGMITIDEGQILWLNDGETVVEYECENDRHDC